MRHSGSTPTSHRKRKSRSWSKSPTLLSKIEGKPTYNDAFISTRRSDITILSRDLHDGLHRSHRMLQRILDEGKKDPDKETWLKELGAYKQQ
jgi:hypothetical protein